jgi:hypothetical protein
MKGLINILKRQLGQLRLKFRLALFQNNRSLATNFLHELYHYKTRLLWRRSESVLLPEYAKKASAFSREGYLVIPPTHDPAFLEKLSQSVDSLFERSEGCVNLGPGLSRLRDGYELLPELESFLTEEVDNALQHYFRSFFKIYSINIYRIIPDEKQPDQSFLWHLDNCPRSVIKLMVYLDDTTEETGAFRLKPRSVSEILLRQGFWDRKKNDQFSSILDDHTSTKVIEGPVGTSILFQDGRCIHKATLPRRKHRDVVTFVVQPSDIHWKAHLARNRHRMSLNAGFCMNPFTDRPQATGEYQ